MDVNNPSDPEKRPFSEESRLPHGRVYIFLGNGGYYVYKKFTRA
jgi:hypothetical protein